MWKGFNLEQRADIAMISNLNVPVMVGEYPCVMVDYDTCMSIGKGNSGFYSKLDDYSTTKLLSNTKIYHAKTYMINDFEKILHDQGDKIRLIAFIPYPDHNNKLIRNFTVRVIIIWKKGITEPVISKKNYINNCEVEIIFDDGELYTIKYVSLHQKVIRTEIISKDLFHELVTIK